MLGTHPVLNPESSVTCGRSYGGVMGAEMSHSKRKGPSVK